MATLYSTKTKTTASAKQITGTSKDVIEDFKGEASKMWFYIGRVINSSTETSVMKFLKSKITLDNDEQVIIEKLNSSGRTNSFKLGIDSKFCHDLNNESFWPKNIIFRKFNFRLSHQSTLSYSYSGNNFNSDSTLNQYSTRTSNYNRNFREINNPTRRPLRNQGANQNYDHPNRSRDGYENQQYNRNFRRRPTGNRMF